MTDRPREQLAEILRAIRLLATGRWRAAELAGELSCTTRTAQRLLVALERSGVEVHREREGKEVYLRIRKGQARQALGLG